MKTELFFNAIRNGELQQVEQLAKETPALVHTKDARGSTALVLATYYNQIEITKLLIEQGADINAVDGSGNTPLMGVCFKGYANIAELLVNHGASLNHQNALGATALIYAVNFNKLAIIKLLLQHQADIHVKDARGNTAINHAKNQNAAEILTLTSKLDYTMNSNDQIEFAKRLKAIAETGLVYSETEYDKERYSELKEMSLQLIAHLLDQPLDKLQNYFIEEKDYPTPKVDVRAFVLNQNNQVLLAKEQVDGKWTIPGGWAEIGDTPSEVAIREAFEETGIQVQAKRVLAVYDKQRHPHPKEPYYIYKIVFECTIVGGDLNPGFDMLDAAFFPVNQLPELSEVRILKEQIEQLFSLVTQDSQHVYFD